MIAQTVGWREFGLAQAGPGLLPCCVIGRVRKPLLALSLAAAATASFAAPPSELRGLWVVRTALVSPEAVDRVVDDAAASGLNALFVQVRGRGDAFYKSALAPRSPLLERQPRSFDPLERLLHRARTRGLTVHAWINVLLTAHFGQPIPRGHVLDKHPEWAMVPKSITTAALVAAGPRRLELIAAAGRAEGDVEGYYLSPSIPAVHDHLEKVVRELLRSYNVDGLHLDFIRYPNQSFDYSRPALDAFRRSTGALELLAAPGQQPQAWDGYRREVLTALTKRLAAAARAERPRLVLSAAVTPDEALAVNHKFQDWPRWAQDEVLAALCPMTYTSDSRLFTQQLEAMRERAGTARTLWAGIGAYRLDVPGVVEKVTLARRAGAQGVLLFSHESFASGDLRQLGQQVFGARVAGGSTSSAVPSAGDQ
jgi:uncharacterized lipoprotein YddW (UPF0748 family)